MNPMTSIKYTHRNERGFTFIEIIVTLIIAAILGAMLIQFMGSSMTGSVEPVIRVQNAFTIEQVMEKMTADYKKLMAEDADPMGTFKGRVGNEGVEVENNYGKYKVECNHYIIFDSAGSETSGGDRILKVSISNVNGEQRLTALFTK